MEPTTPSCASVCRRIQHPWILGSLAPTPRLDLLQEAGENLRMIQGKTLYRLLIVAVVGGYLGWHIYHRARLSMTVETDLFSQGQVELNRGEYKSAIEIFDVFLSRDPNHVPALQFKLRAEVNAGRKTDALKTAERILRLDPSPGSKAMVAEVYRLNGKEEDARKLLNLPDPVPSASASPTSSPSSAQKPNS